MRFVIFLIPVTLAIAGEFATSIGDTYPYLVSAMTTDSAGNTYVVGSRVLGSANVVLNPNLNTALAGGSDVFVTKLDPSGKVLFNDHFAGKGVDTGTAIALDPAGNVYIAGTTTSDDFPLSNALQTQPCSCSTGFIMKLSNDGAAILYSTYFGGTLGTTSITSLATDANGNLYLSGTTYASDFPHTSGMPFGQIQSTSSLIISGAMIASISAAGDKILYSGAISGTVASVVPPSCGSNHGTNFCEALTNGGSLAVDAAGNAYVAGTTGAALPVTTGTCSPGRPFVARVNPGGTGLGYLTCVPTGVIAVTSMAVDAADDLYLAGMGDFGGFVYKLSPDASATIWSASVTGDLVQSIAIDGAGNVWVTGLSYSNMIANTNGWTTGGEFLAGLNTTGHLTYSAQYPTGTVAQSVAVDASGLVHVAGMNGFISSIATVTPPTMKIFALQNAAGGNATARISPGEVISISGPGIGPAAALTATPAGGFYPTTLGGVQVTINGLKMPLLSVSANQVEAVVPMELAGGSGATVQIINGTNTSPSYPVWIVEFAPQAFPGVLNQDGTLNSQANPAKGGSVVTFYATGWQSNFSPLSDGQVAAAALDQCQETCQAGSNATVLYGGAAPGIVAGVSQFNILLGSFPNLTSAAVLNVSVSNIVFTNPAFTQTLAYQNVWITP